MRASANFNSGYGVPAINALLAKYNITGQVRFVCNRSTGRGVRAGYGDYDEPYSTLASALADGELKADSGDAVVCLPGHAESAADTSMLTSLANGVAILGIGNGGMMPTFTFTAAGSQWVMDNNNTLVAGLKLDLGGANGVTKAINITGADVTIRDCEIIMASGAALKATIGVEIGTAAHRCRVLKNRVRGTATHNVTDGFKLVGAAPASDVEFQDNVMIFSATAGNGLIHVTVANKNLYIANNVMYNTHTASTATIALDNVACDGLIYYGGSGTVNDGVNANQGVVVAGANVLVRCIQHYGVDEKAKNGAIVLGAPAT